MKKIGITGGIGAGKSLVCHIFEILGIPNYPADQRAKWLQKNNIPLKNEIIALLGPDAYLTDGELNRQYISKIVFNNAEKLSLLNELVHPAVAKDFDEWCKMQTSKPFILKEAALLFETGSYKALDANILVHANEEIRMARVLNRDPHRTKEEIQKIMQQQMAEEEKISLANHIILNNESSPLIKQCVELFNLLKGESS